MSGLFGYRHISKSELCWSNRLTDQFEPTNYNEVLYIFKKVSAVLGLNDTIRTFIDALMKFTQPIDWQKGGWPLVWPSNEKLCYELGWDERKLQRIRQQAIDLGLIKMHEIKNCKRWGRRNAEGIVVDGCGYVLSPLAERKKEFLTLLAEEEDRQKQLKALKQSCGYRKKQIIGLASFAIKEAYNEDLYLAFIRKAKNLYACCARSCNVKRSLEIDHELCQLYGQTEAALAEDRLQSDDVFDFIVDETMNMSPKGDKFTVSNTTTTKQTLAKANTIVVENNAQEEISSQTEERRSSIKKPFADPSEPLQKSVLNGFIVTPNFILKIAPAFRDWVNQGTASWRALEEAVPYVLHHLGINRHAWAQASLIFGLNEAIAVLSVIDARHSMGLVRSPGGLLRRFVELYQLNKLHLDKTLFSLVDYLQAQFAFNFTMKNCNNGNV